LGFQIELCCRYFGLFLIWQLFGLFFKNLALFSNFLVTLMLQLFGGIVVGSIGYPFCVTITQSVFSKMLGPRPQVTSLSRISTRDSAVGAF
jgi:hypothetical protein